MQKRLGLMGLLLILAVGCGGAADEPQMISAIDPTPTLEPTPTLVSGLSTVAPTTPTGETAVSPPTPTPLPTLTPFPTPTVTPKPAERIEIGAAELNNGNTDGAAEQFEATILSGELADEAEGNTLYALGVAYLQDGRFADALTTFNELLINHANDAPSAIYFHIAQANQNLGNANDAIAAYQTYLGENPEMGAYVHPRIAAMQMALNQRDEAIISYQMSLNSPSHRLIEVENRQVLIDFYQVDGNVEAAIAQYDAIHDVAQTEFTRGQMRYLAGIAELQAGNADLAYSRFAEGMTQYPRAYESYLGLVQLVEAGISVDAYQRGLVNYYAGSYEPCVAAFDRYLAANPDDFEADALLYQAYCWEGLGNSELALQALAAFGVQNPAQAAIETADLWSRIGQTESARDAYLSYLTTYPDGADAPYAAWWTAALTEELGDVETAVSHYRALADNYPWHEDAPEALFHAGWLAQRAGDDETAVLLWQQAAQNYPSREFGAAAMIWLLRIAPTVTFTLQDDLSTPMPTPDVTAIISDVMRLAGENRSVHYYGLRVQDLLDGERPFATSSPLLLPDEGETAVLQAEAETWLRDWLGVEGDISQPSATLTTDTRFVVGGKLWELGLFELSKRELESLRADFSENALSSYQLALYFRELGLYRSSILAGNSVLLLSGQTVFDAPKFIGQLAYPVYYDDLIVPLAEQYGFDPRLQLALVRQESLFESFARSGAAAQGLSQVIPDTGAYIAQQLNWPNYTNDDLYKPYVGLTFGAFYLAQQLHAFDSDVHAALSAYNAGPGNAARWHGVAGSDLDYYVETVNFWETRLYIERIYVGYVIYSYLYGDSS
ncbi:MAG: transglycosylase SLT domain-containing protein [Chloroflexi bacterium]|nr:transglycosylase SLT domain-containing protein [Chloroflexota bacterium]